MERAELQRWLRGAEEACDADGFSELLDVISWLFDRPADDVERLLEGAGRSTAVDRAAGDRLTERQAMLEGLRERVDQDDRRLAHWVPASGIAFCGRIARWEEPRVGESFDDCPACKVVLEDLLFGRDSRQVRAADVADTALPGDD